jgi:hypothetical protein
MFQCWHIIANIRIKLDAIDPLQEKIRIQIFPQLNPLQNLVMIKVRGRGRIIREEEEEGKTNKGRKKERRMREDE